MKFKLLVKLVEKVLNIQSSGDEPRADMYLPVFLLAFGVVLLAIGISFVIVSIVKFTLWMSLVGILGLLLGIAAIMCWKNQKICIVSEQEFEYTTFLGNKHIFLFSQIKALRQNNDSLTLFVADKKVHIESMAIMSDRLVEAINNALDSNN